MGEWFAERIIEAGRLPLFCFFVALIGTFVFIRISVRLIRARARWWFGNIRAGDLHVHHVVFGVVFLMIGGVAGIVADGAMLWPRAAAAALFGVGAGLVLDEFALLLHLDDVYWAEEGRTSVDAVFVAIAVTGLLLLGLTPFGWMEPSVLTLGVNLALAVVTLLKGKIWTGLLGLFLPPLLIPGAVRLARPGSPWGRWFYRPGSRWFDRAVRREVRWRRPIIRAKIAFQEFLSGRHDLPSRPPRLEITVDDDRPVNSSRT